MMGEKQLGYEEFVRAAQLNDAIMEERGENGTDSWGEVGKDLGIDFPGLMSFAFQYSGRVSPPGADELFEMIHLAFCYGAVTMARAVKQHAEVAVRE